MRFAKAARWSVKVGIAIALLSGPAIAQLDVPARPKASLLDLTVTPAGSADAPADQITAVILLYPGTDQVDLELGAEAVDQAAGPVAPAPTVPAPASMQPAGSLAPGVSRSLRPVRAKDEAHRGPDGRFRMNAAARREGNGAAVVKVLLIAPRSAIDVAPRGQLFRYTVHGFVGGVEVFSTATRLIDPSGIRPTPRRASRPEVSIETPVEVLFPVPDAVGSRGNPPAHPGGMPTPQAPSKTLPVAQAPAAPPMTLPPSMAAPSGGGPTSRSIPAPPAYPASPSALIPPDRPFIVLPKRSVLFATNRTIKNATGTPSERFGNAVDSQIRYGSCLVNIPVDKHVQGELELPGWFTGRDPDRFFLIDATTLLSFQAFRDVLAQGGGDNRHDVLVYVHGFNTPFDFAVMRLAQVTHDIQFSGVPLAFSWPSHGSALRYDDDEANAINSVGALTETLRTLVDLQAGRPEGVRGKVHVIAHSLGNRVTLRALLALHGQLTAGQKPFGQIILAAPDVSVSEFVERVPAAQARADRVSLYFCPDDEALRASEIKHPNEPRAGRGIVSLKALDNIDARKANTSFLGHGYWADVKQMLIDMQMLVNLGWGPAERVFTLEPKIAPPEYRYWNLR